MDHLATWENIEAVKYKKQKEEKEKRRLEYEMKKILMNIMKKDKIFY